MLLRLEAGKSSRFDELASLILGSGWLNNALHSPVAHRLYILGTSKWARAKRSGGFNMFSKGQK